MFLPSIGDTPPSWPSPERPKIGYSYLHRLPAHDDVSEAGLVCPFRPQTIAKVGQTVAQAHGSLCTCTISQTDSGGQMPSRGMYRVGPSVRVSCASPCLGVCSPCVETCCMWRKHRCTSAPTCDDVAVFGPNLRPQCRTKANRAPRQPPFRL